MSILTVQNLSHLFGDQFVLKSVNVQLNWADHVGLIGPNGAGKSALLQILSATILHDTGKVDRLPGTEIGHLEQHISLKPGRSIFDQLRTAFAKLYALEREMQSIADGLGLKELGLETPVDALSWGQRIKVLLAELLLQQTDVLLLDEPTNHLDSEAKESLRQALTHLKAPLSL